MGTFFDEFRKEVPGEMGCLLHLLMLMPSWLWVSKISGKRTYQETQPYNCSFAL